MISAQPIAVVGGGMAGLSCATALQAAGFSVAIFDKSRGVGGRMSTRRGQTARVGDAEAATWYCDHGAQYFTATTDVFREEVARWCAAGAAAQWHPRVLDDTPLAKIAGDAAVIFVGTPHMTSPATLLASSLHPITQTTVTALHRNPDGWQLTAAEAGSAAKLAAERFQAVVIAIPSPQCVALLSGFLDTQTVSQLPDATGLGGAALGGAAAMLTAARSASMHASWTLMLQFAEPVGLPFDAAQRQQAPLEWAARNSSKPGRVGPECWVLQASQRWSDAHLDDPPADVATTLIACFVEMGAPAPQSWTAHRWRYATTDPALGIGATWDADLRLGICGDWMNGGTVESAWCSGQLLAKQLLDARAEG